MSTTTNNHTDKKKKSKNKSTLWVFFSVRVEEGGVGGDVFRWEYGGGVCVIYMHYTAVVRTAWGRQTGRRHVCAFMCVFGATEVHVETRCLSCLQLHSGKGDLLGFPAKKYADFARLKKKKKSTLLLAALLLCSCASTTITTPIQK